MAISLFQHNEAAYHSAVEMLAETGKAAIIHPTGTGKSFIGFKYCEDHPQESVLWLSPSEYIFKTQCENLTATGAEVPDNITFITYAKLSIMSEEEMEELSVDTVIEDEFHRTGAPAWGEGLKKLVKHHPNARHIGFSATNIRYLDNQRDIGIEFYEGNIASQMTLGEAIVRGILNAPTYVLSVFAYQKDYDRLKARVNRTKNKTMRDKASRYLEALRRTLEQSDGLDVIFHKHMTDRHGKYLVFCANVEHMREMISHVPEWFGKIDPIPHVYSAYSNDPSVSKAFAGFKADESDHLKLLFCIDMLNEGVHVEDVSGVILFRPTVSPIIYKQQIGRALSTSKSKDPIIFDIVNNIENLYSIDTIQQEMQEAISYYRFFGEGSLVVNERFKLMDEVRDARELFDQLNDTLVASWDLMYECAKQYYQQNGDLIVPRRYRTADGYSLGSWLYTQRKIYAGEQYGNLNEERIEKLNAIGMHWGSYMDYSWERYYAAAESYYAQHGDLKVSTRAMTKTGLALGAWISRLRNYRKSGFGTNYLTSERIADLDKIGMVWDVIDYRWEKKFCAAKRYYQENGDLDVPRKYVTSDGILLGEWIIRQRASRKVQENGRADSGLTQEQVSRLESIGMLWDTWVVRSWKRGIEEANRYYAQHGNVNVPNTYVSESGFPLGEWLRRRRRKGKEKHTVEEQSQLEALKFQWVTEDVWEAHFVQAKAYYQKHGNLNVPEDYRVGGMNLNCWLYNQRRAFRAKKPSLTKERIQRLEAIGMRWESQSLQDSIEKWKKQYQDARVYFLNHGDLMIPSDCTDPLRKNLLRWLDQQRDRKAKGTLSEKQVHLLNEIGMLWEKNVPWEKGFAHAVQYRNKYHDLNVPENYVCQDGYPLGHWIIRQRRNHKNPTRYSPLSAEQTKYLERLGIVWDLVDAKWQEGYSHAKRYMEAIQGGPIQSNFISQDGFKTGQWIKGQIRSWKEGRMKAEYQDALKRIGLLREKGDDVNSG